MRFVKEVFNGRVIFIPVGALLFMLLCSGLFAGNSDLLNGNLRDYVAANPNVAEKMVQYQNNQRFFDFAKNAYSEAKHHNVFLEKIKEYPVEKKIFEFLKLSQKLRAENKSLTELFKEKRADRATLRASESMGGISGTVSLEGDRPIGGFIEVVAFDEYGFPAGSDYVDALTGDFAIAGLPPGNYYVITQSPYVDEFYNPTVDVTLNHMENWRNAALVHVANGVVTENVDFDLLKGAKITGMIFQADGVTPFPFGFINLVIYDAESPEILMTQYSIMADITGKYQTTFPETGTIKLQAQMFGFKPEFYNGKMFWENADVITVATLNDSIGDINFSLEPGAEQPPDAGNSIAGTVYDESGKRIPAALVFAFDLADSSIASLAISFTDSADFMGMYPGDYMLNGLGAGNFVAYATDFLGPYTGEYYQDAQTPDQATVLNFASRADTLSNIDFSLPMGGMIDGTILDENQVPLKDVLVIALKTSIANVSNWFVQDIDFGFALSDTMGEYVIKGLTDGDYILRTISLFGENGGKYIDEYYDNVPSLLNFQQATPVSVTAPQLTENTDFELALAGSIAGHFFETDGATQVEGNGIALAFNVLTGLPELAIPQYDSTDGSYLLRPLPTGDYALFGMVIPDEGDSNRVFYVSQFYDGARNIQGATPVHVNQPAVTQPVDFKMERTGTLQGFVFADQNFPVGADSLRQTFVVLYDAQTGEFEASGGVTFAGGYRLRAVPPGDYKAVAYPVSEIFAATYYGGGSTFDDPNSSTVTIVPDDTASADITLQAGAGIISGMVYNADGSMPVDGVMVFAYDATGHAVSMGISGMEQMPVRGISAGTYAIPGLVTGNYYVRTFALSRLLSLAQQLLGNFDPGMIMGAFGPAVVRDQEPGIPEFQLYGDLWYDNTPVEVNLEDINPLGLLLRLVLSGGEGFMPFPFTQTVPQEAQLVGVTNPGVTSGINFNLPLLQDQFTALETPGQQMVPENFTLHQNYPNPFNPTTSISFEIPRSTQIQINIYNSLGQKVRSLWDGVKEAGSFNLQWNGTNDNGQQVSSGIYLIRMESNAVNLSRKMILMR